MKLELYDCPYIPLKEYDLPIKKRKEKKDIPCFKFGLLMRTSTFAG